jgi:hypothetical protein
VAKRGIHVYGDTGSAKSIRAKSACGCGTIRSMVRRLELSLPLMLSLTPNRTV